ncbi:hypothetical protein GCM10023075_28130 [Streptosporangium album]
MRKTWPGIHTLLVPAEPLFTLARGVSGPGDELPEKPVTLETPNVPAATRRNTVARVIVDVMLKPEILDAQGQAIARALPRLGFSGVSAVRQGKRFEVEIEGPADEAALSDVRKMAETLLANTVIEDYTVTVES